MPSLYIASLRGAEGKTALGLGLARKWQQAGKKVGYFKPVRVAEGTEAEEGDTAFAIKVLGLGESGDSVSLAAQELLGLPQRAEMEKRLSQASARAAQGKDIVLLEGLSGHMEASATIARWLGAQAIMVAHYRLGLEQELAAAARAFGPALLGVVFNAVPPGKMAGARSGESAASVGIKVLGVLPQERTLVAPTVGEVAQHLQARVIPAQNGMGELVEHFMLGAVYLDAAPLYFGRQENKAVILRLDRPDVQLGALETSVRCLVLTAAQGEPNRQVYYKALDRGVSLLLTEQDTPAVVAAVEEMLGRTRFRQEAKLPLMEELLERHLDWVALNRGLGLPE